MTYPQLVMRTAWNFRRVTDCTMSVALKSAHAYLKAQTEDRLAREALPPLNVNNVVSISERRQTHLDRMRRKAAPIGDVLTRAFDEMGFAA